MIKLIGVHYVVTCSWCDDFTQVSAMSEKGASIKYQKLGWVQTRNDIKNTLDDLCPDCLAKMRGGTPK